MLKDLRYAVRTLQRAPSFTIAAVLTLALGIAANTLVFTLLNSLALRPMPVRDPGRVVRVFPIDARGHRHNLFSYSDYLEYRGHAAPLQDVAAYIPLTVASRINGGDTEDLVGYAVSANYFPMLGIEPALGRAFLPSEEHAGAGSRVAIISHSLWHRRFELDPEVLGALVLLNEERFTIVGIGPERFIGTEPLAPDVWVPIGAQPVVAPGGDLLNARTSAWLLLTGRLAPGGSATTAQASLSLVAQRLAAAYPAPDRPSSVSVVPGTFFTIDPGLRPLILLVLSIVGLVLAIAAANVANLVLARTTARQRELAVRLAIGATRWHIVRQLVTETLVLGLGGGAIGLLISVWTLRLLYPIALSLVPSEWGRVVLDLSPDPRVFAYTTGMAVAAGLALAVVPAWQATTSGVAGALHDDGALLGLTVTRSRMRQSLVILQIATCMVLLVAAALLARGLERARSLDLGFDTTGVVFTEYDLDRHGYTPARAVEYNRALLEFAAGLPGVTSAALTSHVPLHGGVVRIDMRPDGHDAGVTVTSTTVSPEYFRTLGIPVTSGRIFSSDESSQGAPVAVISDALAARFWPDRNAVGRSIKAPDSQAPLTIIGVVHDTSSTSLWRDKEMALYRTMGVKDASRVHLVVRTSNDGRTVSAALRERARAMDARVRFAATPLETLLQLWILPSRVAAAAAAVLGAVALVLASIGIYGLLAYTVRHRTREIGIRMALGASGPDVTRMILSDGSRLIVLGLSAGSGGAAAAGQLLRRFMFDVSPLDPVAFTLVPLILSLVAVAACYLPARRASRIEPLAALRRL
jgi:predicted permease